MRRWGGMWMGRLRLLGCASRIDNDIRSMYPGTFVGEQKQHRVRDFRGQGEPVEWAALTD